MVANLRGNAVSAESPATGQVLAWNGFQWAPTNAGDVNNDFLALCDPSLSEGAVVYVSGENNGLAIVSPSDNRFADSFPARGIVVSKPSATTCKVRTQGSVPMVGLVAGKTYWIGTLGYLTAEVPTPTTSTVYVQAVGFATSQTNLVLQIGQSPVTALPV